MARSYGSEFQARNGATRGFEMPTITGGAKTDLGAAAGTVSLGNAYGSLRGSAVDFADISATAIGARAQDRATAMQMEASVDAQQIASDAQIEAAEIQAKAAKDAASSQSRGSMMGSAFGAIGSIGGALLGLSDATTKSDIQPIEDALTKLRELRPVTFHYKEEWNSNPERMHHGFIAQEYKEVVPDATYYDSDIGKYCIDTGDLIGLLVRAVQQLETKVTRLEAANALVGVK
jgi:hypothetical protein